MSNVLTITEDKRDEVKVVLFDRLFELFQRIVYNAQFGRKEILRPIIGRESLREVSSDNG